MGCAGIFRGLCHFCRYLQGLTHRVEVTSRIVLVWVAGWVCLHGWSKLFVTMGLAASRRPSAGPSSRTLSPGVQRGTGRGGEPDRQKGSNDINGAQNRFVRPGGGYGSSNWSRSGPRKSPCERSLTLIPKQAGDRRSDVRAGAARLIMRRSDRR